MILRSRYISVGQLFSCCAIVFDGRFACATKKSRCRLVIVLGLLALIAGVDTAVGADNFSEKEVTAVFLYNFANFVNWPPDSRQDSTHPFRYCVLDEEITPVLREVLKGETVKGRALSVQSEVTNTDLAQCHILYLGKTNFRNPDSWNLVRAALAARVLTVSDLENFELRGGMIALVRQDRRIHPRINIDAVERGKLRISAKLLNLATIVRDDVGMEH